MWLEQLRMMKQKSKMTTAEISKISKIPEPTLEKLFSGATKEPKLSTMYQLVHAFGKTLDDLLPSESIKKEPSDISAEMTDDPNLKKILENFDSMNLSGQYALADYSGYLATKEEYRKHSSVPSIKQA